MKPRNWLREGSAAEVALEGVTPGLRTADAADQMLATIQYPPAFDPLRVEAVEIGAPGPLAPDAVLHADFTLAELLDVVQHAVGADCDEIAWVASVAKLDQAPVFRDVPGHRFVHHDGVFDRRAAGKDEERNDANETSH